MPYETASQNALEKSTSSACYTCLEMVVQRNGSVELLLQKLLSVNDLPGQISLACCKASVPSAVFHKYSR